MLLRVRATIDDRPGGLAAIARACGDAGVNIISLQVFKDEFSVTDEFIVSVPQELDEFALAELISGCGADEVAVTHCRKDAAAHDSALRYLDAAKRVLVDQQDISALLSELLDTEPPDVGSYTGHDTLTVTLPHGENLSIHRVVPFTPTERARAQALASLVTERLSAPTLPLTTPENFTDEPLVRESTLGDLQAIVELHERCTPETLFDRYQMPLAHPMGSRMARRLAHPETGLALVTQVGLDVVGHAVLEPESDDTWTLGILIEDAWQGRGLAAAMILQAADRVRDQGAHGLVLITHGHVDRMLKAVGRTRFQATMTQVDTATRIEIAL